MAISKPTPKDVGTYEAKLMGPFTKRQVVCIGIGIVPTVLVASLLSALAIDGYTIAGVAMMFMVIPCFFAFGSVLCYGQKPEDFLIEYYQYHLKSKKVRLYATDTLDDKLDIVRKKELKKQAEEMELDPKQKKPKEPKKDKNVVATKTKFKDPRFEVKPHKASKEYRTFS